MSGGPHAGSHWPRAGEWAGVREPAAGEASVTLCGRAGQGWAGLAVAAEQLSALFTFYVISLPQLATPGSRASSAQRLKTSMPFKPVIGEIFGHNRLRS